MSFTLLIVESPSKARTIQKYLDSGYKVVASFGHVMDLPEKEFGVDIANDFAPDLIVTKRAMKTVREIKSLAKSADNVILAADPDREGEAICFHLSTLLSKSKSQIARIALHEITKIALTTALKSPGKIQMDLVESQMTRRVLDRIVGYKLSPVLWKHLHNPTLSAGRVQSVVLRWICERELEIQNFKSEEYWRLSVKTKTSFGEELVLSLEDKDKTINSQKKVEEVWKDIFGADCHPELVEGLLISKSSDFVIDVSKLNKSLKVTSSKSEAKKKFPPPPFITASLQKEAGGKLKFSTKKTMSVAQKLYEGVYTGKEHGTTGLITYMRTDSTRLSEEFQNKAKSFIENRFGSKYIGNYKARSSKPEVQDAHEAIRPANTSITPEKLKGILPPDEWNLYNLIWKRAVASQMSPEEGINQSVEAEISGYKFSASGRKVLFEGFTAIYPESKKDNALPELKVGDHLKILETKAEQKHTEPPARFTEASLVEKMEKEGIGRPSTYSNSIEVLYKRKYALQKQKSIFPTELGLEVNTFLTQKMAYLFENHFTRDVEADLDQIALGKLKRIEFLKTFYQKFQTALREIELQKPISKKKKSETENLCPLCQSKVLKRKNPKGKAYFICSQFPECEYMEYVV
ncbi:MAG: type I DNA topoisomerase [Leptospiraceae bacterium]|nr:type I DNA topoisomerase [Leptospiraceae bacterium]